MFINKKNLKYLLILSSIISGVVAEQSSQKGQTQQQDNTLNSNAEQKNALQNNSEELKTNSQIINHNIGQKSNIQTRNNIVDSNIEKNSNSGVQNNTVEQNNDVKISSNNEEWETCNESELISYRLQNKLQRFLNEFISDINSKNYNDVYYNDFTPFSNHVYQYIRDLINTGIINNVNDIESIWQEILSNTKKKVAKSKNNNKKTINNKINSYKINSIKEIMDYYVSVRLQIIKEQIDGISQIDALNQQEIQRIITEISSQNFIEKEEKEKEINIEINEQNESRLFNIEYNYTGLINIFNWAQELFIEKDANTVIAYIKEQFNFKKQEILQHINNIVNSGIFNKILKQCEIPLFISKIQQIINNLQTFNKNNIINEIQNERINFKNNLDYILFYIRTNNIWSVNYIKSYIKDCLNVIQNNNTISYDKNIFYENLKKVLNTMKNQDNFKLIYKSIIVSFDIENVINKYKENLNIEIPSINNQNYINLGIHDQTNNFFTPIPKNFIKDQPIRKIKKQNKVKTFTLNSKNE